MSSIEVNDALFCEKHIVEKCEDCEVNFREENDSFFGFESRNREALFCPPASKNDAGTFVCDKHRSETCNVCFCWKKQITRLRAAAKN
jgi:predicted membrane GTPase involved in stress response